MSEMGEIGFAPNISLDTLQKYPRVFGLGPLGKMQGEITLVDGVPFAGTADLEGNPFIQTEWNIEAPFFVYSEVDSWDAFPLEGTIADQAELEKMVESVAVANGYDLADPFVFRVSGTFDGLVTHIVTPRSADIPGFKTGRNQENYTHKKESGKKNQANL